MEHLIDISNPRWRAWMRRLWMCLSDMGFEVDGAYESPYFEGACICGQVGEVRTVYRVAATTMDQKKQSPYFVAKRCVAGMDDTPFLIWSLRCEVDELSAELEHGI